MKFEFISMDFIMGFPKTQASYDSILVVVDQSTKLTHFISTLTIVTTSNVAELFMKNVFKIHGLPLEMISHRDKKKLSDFWTKF